MGRRIEKAAASSAGGQLLLVRSRPRSSFGRRGARALGDVLLWIVAALGATCVVLVILAVTANMTLIMFRTGSMSPTIPAGSVALVQRIPAADIRVDDIITIDRDGELPITHRVTSVSDGPSAAARSITMRGDANVQDDPAPYIVSTARIVRFSVPGVAVVVAAMQTPLALACMTLGAGALVLWAFWPRLPRGSRSGGTPS